VPAHAESPIRFFLATSNPGKRDEYRAMATGESLSLDLLPDFSSLPPFDESAPTFAENAAGKALHYSRLTSEIVLADDSGLVVPALGGQPGVHSARYAGPGASDADRVKKLLAEMRNKNGEQRKAHFVCVIAVAQRGAALSVVSAQADGILLEEPRGQGGFGYDPIFLFPSLGKTFAELSREEKNQHSHRGQAFQRLLASLLP
jgi:XTP/dITP diphosphohydrolase